MIISIILLLLMGIFGLSASIKDLILNIQNEIKLSGNDTYNGIIYTDSSIKIDEKFNISIPEKFKNYSTKYEYNYSYSSNNKIFNKCMFRLSSPTGYKDANILVEQMHSYYKEFNPTNITQNGFNNINWYNFSFNNNFGKTYYYITSKDSKVYILQYDINIDTDFNCESYKNQIINSIISK